MCKKLSVVCLFLLFLLTFVLSAAASETNGAANNKNNDTNEAELTTVAQPVADDEGLDEKKDRSDSRMLGDMNADGRVTAADARIVLRTVVGLDSLPAQTLAYSDLNNDGIVAAEDARLTLRTAVGLESVFRHDFTVTALADATCTESGSLFLQCSDCGQEETLQIPALGHRYGVEEITAATCTKDGSAVSVCEVCKSEKNRVIPATGHAYEETLTSATCTDNGFKKLVCRNCGDMQETVLKATGHKWIEATAKAPKHCSVCGETVSGWAAVNGLYYYYNPDGSQAVNQIMDRRYVDENGVRSNDSVIQLAVNYVIANGGNGTNAQKLSNCYYAMVRTCRYSSIRGVATASNLPQKASSMFKTHYGHCYSYASMFAYIAKVLGYSVRVNSGMIRSASGKMAAHGWTEIKINGGWYMFDVTSHIYRRINGYMRTHANFPIYHTSGTLFYLVTKNSTAYWTK